MDRRLWTVDCGLWTPRSTRSTRSTRSHEPQNLLHRDFQTALSQVREFLADAQVRGGDCQPPGHWRVAEKVARQGQEGAGLGGVGQDGGNIGGLKAAELHLARGVHRGIDENDNARARHGLGQLGRQEGASQGLDPRQPKGRDGLRHARADAIIAPERVAVADDKKGGVIRVHSSMTNDHFSILNSQFT